MNVIEEIKVFNASDNKILNGGFEELASPTELISNKDFSTWSYLSGAITVFSDAGGGEVNCLDVGHGLITNDKIEIRQCTTVNGSGYDGAYSITKVNNDNFKITHAWDGTETARWVKISTAPTNWDVNVAMTITKYIVPAIGGGLKIVSDSDSFYIYQEEAFLDVQYSRINYVVEIGTVVNEGLELKDGATEIIDTFTTEGIHAGNFVVVNSADLRLEASTTNTNIIIKEVSCIVEQLFENWEQSYDGTDGIVEEVLGYKGQRAVKLIDVGGDEASIKQSITGVTLNTIKGKKVILTFVCSTDSQIWFHWSVDNGTIWFSNYIDIKHSYWERYQKTLFIPEDSIGFVIKLLSPQITQNSYAVFDEVKLYYIEDAILEKELIVEKENIKNEIEDDLFTFRADDMSMKLRNKYDAGKGYMNPMDFITEDKLYAMQIKYNTGTESSPVYKYLYLFTNWDNCNRFQDDIVDYINLSFFELSGLLKDQNWYMGRYIYDPEISETGVYRFDTQLPLILDKAGTAEDDDILNDNVLSELRKVIAENMIPVYPNNITMDIASNLLSDDGWERSIDIIDNEVSGKKRLLDYFVDTENNRLFILVIDNTYDDGESTEGKFVDLYEIKNYSTPHYIRTINVEPDEDNFLDIGFVHRWDTYPPTAHDVMVVIIQTFRYVLLQNNYCGKKKSEYKYNNVGDLYCSNEYSANQGNISVAKIHEWNRAYIDNDGVLQENGTIVNADWIKDNLSFILFDNDNVYTISDEESYSDDYGGTDRLMSWAGKMDFNVNKFPKYLQLTGSKGFVDSTLARIMRELCVIQDALWYFKYTNLGIALYIRRRATITGEAEPYIDDINSDSDVKNIATKLSSVTFDDIASHIYQNDPFRIKMFRDFYNDKYGGGKNLKTLTMLGIQNYSLGEVRPFLSSPSVNYMIKRLEWNDKDSEDGNKTMVDLFQLAEGD